MIILKFFFWVFVITSLLGLLVRIFGKVILRKMIRFANEKAREDMERQTKAYQRHSQASPFEKSVFVEDVKVSMDRGNAERKEKEKKKRREVDVKNAESVDFEEID